MSYRVFVGFRVEGQEESGADLQVEDITFFTALYTPLKWFLEVWLTLRRIMEGWSQQLCSVFLPEARDLKHFKQSMCQHNPMGSHVMKSWCKSCTLMA